MPVLDPPSAPTRVVVAVPARDEAALIGPCLSSLDRAAGACGVPVDVVVAADRCRDETAALVASFPARHCTVRVVTGRWGGAGAARAAAIAVAACRGSGVWIANTDADCRVPETWLDAQIELARQGVHAVAGVVRLDPDTAPSQLVRRFGRAYAVGTTTHGHVHAANLGIRADAYHLVGGWSARTALGEEHQLWRHLRRRGLATVHDPHLCVVTSHRTDGRARGGFAANLRRLASIA